jgi:hypothetical protein
MTWQDKIISRVKSEIKKHKWADDETLGEIIGRKIIGDIKVLISEAEENAISRLVNGVERVQKELKDIK